MATDLTAFKPQNPSDLLKEIIERAAGIAGAQWASVGGQLEGYMKSLAQAAFETAQQLKDTKINQQQADFAIHMQELGFHQVLNYAQLLTYETAQKILNGVFQVIVAAVKNTSGVDLNWFFGDKQAG